MGKKMKRWRSRRSMEEYHYFQTLVLCVKGKRELQSQLEASREEVRMLRRRLAEEGELKAFKVEVGRRFDGCDLYQVAVRFRPEELRYSLLSYGSPLNVSRTVEMISRRLADQVQSEIMKQLDRDGILGPRR